ncbi:response regulator receiver modulated diguanylate phosphodiesterase [Methylophilus rhizosphaerae]|uniref:Response regulator receiver modulated diguanylate phosphodiesterase n=1 Tax=Methylophilus rhizosphaerae TaxID=492660 RepID=A0A1G9CRH9_9PROT|nr:EAL domain-containing response regulator [Methylophilus rhizosphaerae]SDK54311.1 response regulator receiver modulated diguanylate phosphodiesterase [Methylophilus rhizosphaerae]
MKTQSLLVLDGDASVANTIAHEARYLGFEVKIVDDPHLFIDEFHTWQPSHLAIDLLLPAIDDAELLAHLGRLHCQSTIIFTNGTTTPMLPAAQLIASENRLSVAGVLPRPIDPQALRSLLSGTPATSSPPTHTGMSREQFIADAASIAHALQHKQFMLYYQPQIDLPSGKVTGLEALLRWRHPTFGMKLPASFIPTAEKTGQITQLMQLVVTSAFDFLQTLAADLSLSFNVSVNNIRDPAFADALHHACQTFNIAPPRVVLEFTGATSLANLSQIEAPLKHLSHLGFKLGMENFGTDYPSTAQLAKLPLSELIIDKSLVASMEHSATSRKVIASAIQLAEKLGLSTLAEGVENDIVAIGLRELGCQSGQGYYFAKPMDRETTAAWLQHWNQQLIGTGRPQPEAEKVPHS